LRAHDLARCKASIQDGFAGRLRLMSIFIHHSMEKPFF
jgi:hypothetical protein